MSARSMGPRAPAALRGGRWAFLCLAVSGISATAPSQATAVQVGIRVVDIRGQWIPARVHIRDALGHAYPGWADSTLLSHNDGWTGGYLYPAGPITADLPPGLTRIAAGKGFEWEPVEIRPYIQGDTSLTITLLRSFDLRAEGWFGGDGHVHTNHLPMDYPVPPPKMLLVAQAEDLAISWILDNEYQFTGGPHEVSTPETVLYYTTEWRNNAYGHAAVLGLKQMIGTSCCGPSGPAYPMLSTVREAWSPEWDEALTLSHPRTGAAFFDDGGWPASGLGRELPVLASSGNLDAYDVVSYSNAGDIALGDWYGLLNCGLRIPPSAGTDGMTDRYWSRPPGGYRVYVDESGGAHDPARWVEGLKAGRVFVTNYPLVPLFAVEGSEAGSVLEIADSTASVLVHFRVQSALPVASVQIVRNGLAAMTIPAPPNPHQTDWEHSVSVDLGESSWLALRVDGTTDLSHAASPTLFAHTGPVYVHLAGAPISRTWDAGRFIDWTDSLEIFAEGRGNWPSPEAHEEVLDRLDAARAAFGSLFHEPPEPFNLMAPSDGDTALAGLPILFDWVDAADPEPGDRLQYRLMIAPDSSHAGGHAFPPIYESQLLVTRFPFPPDADYWWRVEAVDRGGNPAHSNPPDRRIFLMSDPAGAGPAVPAGGSAGNGGETRARLRVWLNPSRGMVRFAWNLPRAAIAQEIYDACGRRVIARPQGVGAWDGRDAQGRLVPSGLYWIRCALEPLREPSGSGASPVATAPVLLLR